MGTIREREPGVWEIRVYIGKDPATGQPRQVSRTVKATRTKTGQAPKAVKLIEHQLETEAKAGKLDSSGKTNTVGLLLDRYLEHLDRKGLSPKTLHTYRLYIDQNVRPAFSDKAVPKLTALHLDNLYLSLDKAGKAPATIRQVHAILSGALGQAVKWGVTPLNVAKMASPPKARTAKIIPPTPAEVQAIIAAAEERDPILAALVMLTALTGARRGEMCALRWTDVDLATGKLSIARSVLDIPGRVEEKATKSHQERTIALGQAGIALLELHREGVLDRARICEVDIPTDAFIFSERVDCASPVRPDKVTRFFSAVRDDLGLKHVHLHSLRHFVATQLASLGDVSVRTLAGRLGHADASVTMRTYAAFMPSADTEAADHVGRLLSARKETSPDKGIVGPTAQPLVRLPSA